MKYNVALMADYSSQQQVQLIMDIVVSCFDKWQLTTPQPCNINNGWPIIKRYIADALMSVPDLVKYVIQFNREGGSLTLDCRYSNDIYVSNYYYFLIDSRCQPNSTISLNDITW